MPLTDSIGNPLVQEDLGSVHYEYDWFSGSDIVVMLGDVVLDAAVNIEFTRQQSRSPIYGYANQYYTFSSAGKIFVSGSLTVAFKEAGYLLWPIQRIINLNNSNNSWYSPRYDTNDKGTINRTFPNDTFAGAARDAQRNLNMEANVEQMTEWLKSGKPLTQNWEYNNFLTQLGSLEDGEFEDWAEKFEDAIWYGSDRNNNLLRDKLFARNLPENKNIDEETVMATRNPDLYPPIDIWIVYGDYNAHSPNHTVKKLLDVSFTGSSQTIKVDGEPTYEVYSFMARNIV